MPPTDEIDRLRAALAAAEKERDEALAELEERTFGHWSAQHRAEYDRICAVQPTIIAERDAARAALAESEAGAAAMRRALESIQINMLDETEDTHAWIAATNQTIESALATNAGRAVLDDLEQYDLMRADRDAYATHAARWKALAKRLRRQREAAREMRRLEQRR